MDYFGIDGTWWVPGTDHRASGRLTFDADGIELTLQGALREFMVPPAEVVGVRPEWEVIPIVWGRTNDRRDVTLIDVGGANLRGPFDEVEASYRVGFALIGCHTETDTFAEARVQFDLLDAWADPPSLQTRAEEPSRIEIDTTTRELARTDVGFGSLRLESRPNGSVGDASIHLDRVTQFVATFSTARQAKEVLDEAVRPLNDLLIVALGRPVRLTGLQLRNPDADEREPAADVYFEAVQPARSGESSRSAVIGYTASTLLTGDEAGSQLGAVLARWFDVRDQFRDAIALLLGPMYAPFTYSEHRFASTFQAAEAFHGKAGFPTRELPKSEHRERVNVAVKALSNASIDPEIIAWARRILESRNDKPLWMLIDDLVRNTGRIADAVHGADPDFAQVVASARTGVSHGGATAHLTGGCRYWYGDVLRWIVRSHLLLRLDVPLDRVEHRVLGRAGFEHALQQVRVCAEERNAEEPERESDT
jgi:hypothetical protein